MIITMNLYEKKTLKEIRKLYILIKGNERRKNICKLNYTEN